MSPRLADLRAIPAEFPWRCPKCGSDDVHYVGAWHGGGWLDWECHRDINAHWSQRHGFTTIHY